MCLSDRITGGRARLLDLEALDALRLVDRERGRPVLTAADVADEHARPLSWRALGRARPRLQATKRITGAMRLHHGREDGRACCCGVVDFCVLLPLVPCGSADGVPLPLAWQHPTTGRRCGNIPSSAPPILPTHYPRRTRKVPSVQRSFANGNQGHVLEVESSGRRRLTGVFTTEGRLGLAIDDVTEAGICVGSPALILLKHCGSWMAIEALQTQ